MLRGWPNSTRRWMSPYRRMARRVGPDYARTCFETKSSDYSDRQRLPAYSDRPPSAGFQPQQREIACGYAKR